MSGEILALNLSFNFTEFSYIKIYDFSIRLSSPMYYTPC